MTDLRGVAAALAVSLLLHAGLAVALRGLGLGPAPLPPLLVDLVEPVVAVSGPPAEPGRAPPPPAAARAIPAEPERAVGEARRRLPERSPSPEPPRAAEVPAAPPAPVAVSPPDDAGRRAPEVSAPPVPPPPLVALPRESVSAPRRSETAVDAEWASTEGQGAAPPASAGVAEAPPRDIGSGATAAAGPPGPNEADADIGKSRGAGPAASGAGESGRGARGTGDRAEPLATRASGRGAAIPPEYDVYVQALRRRIQDRLAYPWLAVRRQLQGSLELEIRLDADGRLTEVAVVSGDGSGPLREAAIRAVREATPFPFPAGLVSRALTIRLPVVFELR